MKKTNGMPSGTIAFIICVLFFLISWLWLLPKYKQNEADYARVNYEASAAKDKLGSLKLAQNTLDELGTTVDLMQVAIPATQDAGNIITTLEAIAAKNKAYIPSFQIVDGSSAVTSGSVGAPSDPNAVSVAFTTSGTFDDLTAMVHSIETNLKFFNIRTLSVSAGDKGMSMTFQLEAYKQKNTSSLAM